MTTSEPSGELPFLKDGKIDWEGDTHSELSGGHGAERLANLFQLMQRGLVYPAPYARFVSLWARPGAEITRQLVGDAMRKVRETIHADFGSANTTAVLGVSFPLYRAWCAADGRSVPAGMSYLRPAGSGDGETSDVFERSNGVFQDSGASLWVHIKSDRQADLEGVYQAVLAEAGDLIDPERTVYQDCDSRVTGESKDGKVLGCRFSENLNNPADPVTLAHHTLVGYEDVEHAGGSYVLAQRFTINWEQLHNMTEEQIEDLIGRTAQDVILPTKDTRTHINSARQRDERGNSMFVMRLGLPFGRAQESKYIVAKGGNLRDERGIYFAGFARSVRVFETIMNRQIGDWPGFMNDRLFNHVRSDLGGFFYVPSRADLDLDPEPWEGRGEKDWRHFPGIGWERLSRHFRERSPNGRMFYNHKNYLYEMSAGEGQNGAGAPAAAAMKPPSTRVLSLLLDCFTRWQDAWYFPKNQPPMGHLCGYLARDPDFGEAVAGQVMGLPIMERKAWAIRMTCRLYASDGYGYRGYDWKTGQEGADTYRIHAWELIAGALPDLSLAQGRFVIRYLQEDEEMPMYFRGLSEASGVGHIVPDYQKLVDVGLGGLLEEVQSRLDETEDPEKQSFYRACAISLQGVQDHLRRYAELARRLAAGLAEGQTAERDNLEQMARRLDKLATDKPETMLEAAQLVFTMHSCLQLNGEPCAVGRLDQVLDPFYRADREAGRLSEDEAQEIVDAFWIKLSEKVLLNRIFINDHQPYGNLAMGGAAGPYPQGASLGQWIQQVTVGGWVADENDRPTPADNEVTSLCLRAAARLPLNAPCLSLRVHKGTPRRFLEEAAAAILSGGAHPVLLNDDKIVAGLKASGDGMGGEPVRARAGKRWRSEVSLESARNYACDGCYEPMFVGQNWFTLGGFTTLHPLECALNQGRLYASAGPAYLRGMNHSFRSKAPGDVESFDELLDLYYKHFYWLVARALDGQLSSFDALVSICPTPLLSTLIDDCLAKGLDLYGGGARYNIFAPCFIAASSTINSLYCIEKMVFDRTSAMTSLPELVDCLICDWGHKLVEPIVSSLIGPTRTEGKAERWKRFREIALAYPRYGQGDAEIDEFGNRFLERIAHLTVKVFREPAASTAEKMIAYAEKYGTPEQPFGFQVHPGVGTFENFIAFGEGSGASADGRRLGEAIASDLSAAPAPMDRPPAPARPSFSKALAGYSGAGTDKIWDGAPTDFNIAEDFPFDDLVDVLQQFADGQGSNILTVTCASPETLADAPARPERYDLLRVRMGGWSEFFTSMFPQSQQQHLRRPVAVP
jgi:Dyp-type peroxidase family